MSNFDMKDYVPVNERIDQFYRAHPEGSLQSEIVELTAERVTVKALAYRVPDDPRPGIGHSSLEIPGKTSFTKGSEIENAETSAWGRAIAALGFEVKRGLASAEEVRNKQPEQRGPAKAAPTPNAAPVQYRRGELAGLMKQHGLDLLAVEAIADRLGITERPMSNESMDRLIEAIQQPQAGGVEPSSPTAAVGEAGAETPASHDDPTPDAHTASAVPVSATPEAVDDSPVDAPPVALSMDDVLEAAGPGAEEIPPAPGTDAFKELDSKGKLDARVWHQTHPAEAGA
jgi:hypothetical protein